MAKMKTYIAIFWRSNPQLKGGGYYCARDLQAGTEASAERKAIKEFGNPVYGSMSFCKVVLKSGENSTGWRYNTYKSIEELLADLPS